MWTKPNTASATRVEIRWRDVLGDVLEIDLKIVQVMNDTNQLFEYTLEAVDKHVPDG